MLGLVLQHSQHLCHGAGLSSCCTSHPLLPRYRPMWTRQTICCFRTRYIGAAKGPKCEAIVSQSRTRMSMSSLVGCTILMSLRHNQSFKEQTMDSWLPQENMTKIRLISTFTYRTNGNAPTKLVCASQVKDQKQSNERSDLASKHTGEPQWAVLSSLEY